MPKGNIMIRILLIVALLLLSGCAKVGDVEIKASNICKDLGSTVFDFSWGILRYSSISDAYLYHATVTCRDGHKGEFEMWVDKKTGYEIILK